MKIPKDRTAQKKMWAKAFMAGIRKQAQDNEWDVLLYALDCGYTVKNAEFFTSEDFAELDRWRTMATELKQILLARSMSSADTEAELLS